MEDVARGSWSKSRNARFTILSHTEQVLRSREPILDRNSNETHRVVDVAQRSHTAYRARGHVYTDFSTEVVQIPSSRGGLIKSKGDRSRSLTIKRLYLSTGGFVSHSFERLLRRQLSISIPGRDKTKGSLKTGDVTSVTHAVTCNYE